MLSASCFVNFLLIFKMKNKTSCRTLPLIPAVEEELLKQKEKQQLYRKLFKKSYSTEYLDFVCTDQEGKLIRPNFVTEHFDWLLRKYSLPPSAFMICAIVVPAFF